MKKQYYHRERTLPFYIAFVIVFTFLYLELYIIHADSIDIKFLLIAIVCIIVPMCSILKSIVFLNRKNRCLTEGKELKGIIVGKVGITLFSGGYCYRLVVKYNGGRTVTPPMKAKYADRLKSRECLVYEYEDQHYVTGFTMCEKKEDPAEIRVMQKNEI